MQECLKNLQIDMLHNEKMKLYAFKFKYYGNLEPRFHELAHRHAQNTQ